MSRILVVDDEDPFRSTLAEALATLGHVVMEARNGSEALRLAAVEPPDLALVDIIMPDKEGLETISTLRRDRPELPIIAMSGGSGDSRVDYLKIAQRMGATCTLAKPFPLEMLVATLAEAVRRAEKG